MRFRSLSIRPGSSEITVLRVMRISILFVGALATLLAITADSVYDLWALRFDYRLAKSIEGHKRTVSVLISFMSSFSRNCCLSSTLKSLSTPAAVKLVSLLDSW